MGDKEFKVIKLEQENYAVWKWQFVNVLRAKKLDAVLTAEFKPEEASQALALLGSSLSTENILKIINCETFGKAWETIQACFENKTAYQPQYLHRRLNSFKINSASDVSAGLSEMRGIIAQLKNLNETVSDNALIGAILAALPSSFDLFTTVWKNSASKDVDGLINKLMAEATDQMLKEKDDVKALAARSKGNSKPKVNKNQCRYCKEEGHWVKDCKKLPSPYDPSKGKNKNYRNKNDKQGTSNESNKDNEDLAFITIMADKLRHSRDIWVADSGCTNHMSPHRELFSSFKMIDNSSIQLANESSVQACGQGEILTAKGKLTNVLFVPGLGQNLFSISAAASTGLTHVGLKDSLKFFKNDREVFTATLMDKLYLIKLEPRYVQVAEARAATLSEWHERFNHVSPETIKLMQKNKVVEGLNITSRPSDHCQDCAMNKCTQVSHPTRTTVKAKQAGNVLHMDTAGPSNVESKGGSRYMILCKDEFSKYRQVAFVKTKDLIVNKVKEFVSKAQLETSNQVLKIVTDNGSEFCNNEITSFFENRGIIHEKSVPYVPMQNGFIERDIRTVKEAAKSMLNKSNVNKNLWPEAVNCAIYTLNRVLNSSNSSKTPYELWFGSSPNVNNLRIFGEKAIIKKNTHQQSDSWDTKGSEAMFLGYTDRSNTYRFLQNDKIVISCNVTFLNKMWNQQVLNNDVHEPDEFWVGGNSEVCVDRGENDLYIDQNIDSTPPVNEDHARASAESLQDSLNESLMQSAPSSPGEAQPNQAQPSSNQEMYINVPQNVTNRTTEKAQEILRLKGIFNSNPNVNFKLSSGVEIAVKDLEYKENANNWRSKKLNQFISKEIIHMIAGKLQQQGASIARALLTADSIQLPKNYDEAITSSNEKDWKEAMNSEIESLIKNQVYEEVSIGQVSKKPVGSRWVFTIKTKPSGKVDKFKARVVAKGFSQIYGIDYCETYCSVVHIMTTRLFLNYAATKGLFIKQFDIKTAFLYGNLDEEIYMLPPDGYKKQDVLWKLKRSLYGLKQSPRMWNRRFKEFLLGINFKVSEYDNSVFYKVKPIIFVIVYVDDGLIFCENEKDGQQVMNELNDQFEMRELSVNMYRGLQIVQLENGIFVHQANYAKKVLEAFNMSDATPSENPIYKLNDTDNALLPANVPYRSAVGSLAYLADTTRPDISYAVNQLARKMSAPTTNDWIRVKQVMRYIRGTFDYGIMYQNTKCGSTLLLGYSDSDYAGNETTSKSTAGYLIEYNMAAIHWKSQLQKHVTLSSSEAEVIALCTLSKELAWIRRMCIELNLLNEQPAVILCDNTSAIKIAMSEKATTRTRHLRAQDAFIREQVELKELQVKHVSAIKQKADLLTKIVSTGKFVTNRNMILKCMCA